ncbi:hypothetical protein ACWD4G_29655 [Streptomyces sp. NPDC002643]
MVTGEEVILLALRSIAARGEWTENSDLVDSDEAGRALSEGAPSEGALSEQALSEQLARFRVDPVTVDQLAARRGGLMTSGLATTILTSSLVVAVVAQIIADQVQVGARAAIGKVSRWRAGRRGRQLVSALGQPAQPFGAQDAQWLRGYVTAQCEGIGCPPEQAAAVAEAVATAWLARGRDGRRGRDGDDDPGTRVREGGHG